MKIIFILLLLLSGCCPKCPSYYIIPLSQAELKKRILEEQVYQQQIENLQQEMKNLQQEAESLRQKAGE